MMSRIERIRRPAKPGSSAKAEVERLSDADAFDPRTLPIPASSVRVVSDVRYSEPEPPSVFAAQLIGQHGQKRGLRAGPMHIDAANGAYNKIEWSGSKDRRAVVGQSARTKI